ncbi:MAG: ZIP family metal transporter [Candidatus Portnoybacteria bacterium CG10_big_fil_rev_8_21_14_0_10_44_7]|uniref:ZIP family metal transporter n=1 Tax=Candidatus Portnoybacteria bacterium CG10_big_fil_rev_8_21_14_0_10_44_7 TaxID=1974816 RepID=A0A2M8KID6_9BACT|nr:MAG: ZIP family metal transporter [Candidatus Portnoybacteria bacterium CG10_big_fil_rev_8_21_14_0_10_44_7]
MEKTLFTLGSVLVLSLISLVGVFWLRLKTEKLKKLLLFLVSFSAGALLGDAFLHLLPEIFLTKNVLRGGLAILAGIFLFLLLESFICWRHCHQPTTERHIHPVGITNLFGDGLHNFIDGMLIAGSFLVSIPLGVATSLAVALHEIPQEIGDFGILLHAGFSRRKALLFNFLSALLAALGAGLVLWLGLLSAPFINFILGLTAGGFIYIACADLIPEIHKTHQECHPKHSFFQILAFLGGVGIMAALLLLE